MHCLLAAWWCRRVRALVYLHGNGDVRSLQEPAEREALDRLRATLSEASDVHLDPAFRHSVRVFRLDAQGRRRGLTAERVAEAVAATLLDLLSVEDLSRWRRVVRAARLLLASRESG